MKPLGKVRIEWSPEFAYAIGLITSDGNLSPNGRTINFTTKDLDLAETFKRCLRVTNPIGRKRGGFTLEKKYFVVQIGDILFYQYLLSIGLMSRKSKVLGALYIPEEYVADFLRGHLDGDGTFHSYWDTRWKNSFMFYTIFNSASEKHIHWLRSVVSHSFGITGHVTRGNHATDCYHLKYAKRESLILLEHIYYSAAVPCLERKRLKIEAALSIIGKHL